MAKDFLKFLEPDFEFSIDFSTHSIAIENESSEYGSRNSIAPDKTNINKEGVKCRRTWNFINTSDEVEYIVGRNERKITIHSEYIMNSKGQIR